MKLNKIELVGGLLSIGFMAAALFLLRVETTVLSQAANQPATAVESQIVMVGRDGDTNRARAAAYLEAANNQGTIEKLVVDDVVIGTGDPVESGDTVSIHYIGTLQTGQEFDNSRKRGAPYEFTVGEGRVIKGLEEGIVGMKVGGQRILVIPATLGYGRDGYGPIPGGATLVYSIELLEVR